MAGFTGQAEYVVDGKGRIALPARMRRNLRPESDNTLVMIRGFEQCINVYPLDRWGEIEGQMESLNPYRREDRAYLRSIMRWVHEDSLDTQGRLSISRQLMDYAGIAPGSRATIVGAMDHIEIWNPETLEVYFEDQPEDFESLAERVMGRRTSEP